MIAPSDNMLRLTSASGLEAQVNQNGSLRRLDCASVCLTLFPGSEVEGGLANLYLRRHAAIIEWVPLLGPRSPTVFRPGATPDRVEGVGSWGGVRYSISLVLAADAPVWFWHVQLENTAAVAQRLDVTYAQDVALAPYGAVRMNEFYVSQYIDHTPLEHATRGVFVASRQNQAVDGRYPWSLIGSLRHGLSFATDALQFYGLTARASGAPIGLVGDLPGRRLQHEHSLVAIRDDLIVLEPNQSAGTGFFGLYMPDHPSASAPADLTQIDRVTCLPEAQPVRAEARPGAVPLRASLFNAPPLTAIDLDSQTLHALFRSSWRHEERDARGELLSFFHGVDHHVVLRAKELRVQRPHGHLLRTGRHLTPAETSLTSTAWMGGVFHSMVTQGHVSINRFLSTTRSYLGLFRAQGQRVFVELDGVWQLLDLPSAFEMAPQACRWIYRHAQGVIQVRAEALGDQQALTLSVEVLSGPPIRCLIAHHVALNGDDGATSDVARWQRDHDDVVVVPATGSELAQRFPDGAFRLVMGEGTRIERLGGDELLYADGVSRHQPYLCLITAASERVVLSIRGQLIREETQSPLFAEHGRLAPSLTLHAPATSTLAAQVAQLADIVPWFTQNALVHYLAPRGLEQYSGGGWGTRDVCQGPVELLLALGQAAPIRDVLLRVMAMQNPDGDWPQWFMFFERERNIRAGDSHGDVVFWPLVVLAQYLTTSGDASVLEERVRFFDAAGPQSGELANVWQHVQRALALIDRRVVPGTALAAYGHGDWNDSLQPADPRMREHMCSAWTVTLHVQALRELARALRAIGRASDADDLEHKADAARRDFQRLLIVDGVLTGYASFEAGKATCLLHPSDQRTGVRYSALAMIHAILEDLFTPQQVQDHLKLIEAHLSAVDGVHLFDRPMTYHGGPQQLFQRAETATYFGREIGLMYMHAHLRYAQALAHIGAADRFFHALCQANPIGLQALVPTATSRQVNCYYSSSDAAFADRYQASEQYARVAAGDIALDGGWRVYSSGAGIALGLIIRRFLGVSAEMHGLRVDPVMPEALNGMRAEMVLWNRPFEIHYRVGQAGCGVSALRLNGADIEFTRESNPHRLGAALVARGALDSQLAAGRNVLQIEMG